MEEGYFLCSPRGPKVHNFFTFLFFTGYVGLDYSTWALRCIWTRSSLECTTSKSTILVWTYCNVYEDYCFESKGVSHASKCTYLTSTYKIQVGAGDPKFIRMHKTQDMKWTIIWIISRCVWAWYEYWLETCFWWIVLGGIWFLLLFTWQCYALTPKGPHLSSKWVCLPWLLIQLARAFWPSIFEKLQ